ncbi:vitamin K epoxide reductase family protein [Scardovia wiggsiae]|uniref:vitamin K epoxide reductase family protein n=1 Tax=Scardovia wiggsiae TaxID=230143 RepID=UPI00374FCC73
MPGTSENSGVPAEAPARTSATPGTAPVRGWRHTAVWTYLIMLLSSLAALIVSFALSAETLQLARHPHQQLSCDISSAVSCSTVAQSWQAEFIHFAGMSFPNAFFGIAAESVFVTVAVLGISRIAVPRWFALCTWLGGLAALLYAYWLFTQSMYVINALCPWCLGLMFATTVQFISLTHATACIQRIPSPSSSAGRALRTYYRLNIDLLADVVWIIILIALILAKHGSVLLR